MPTGPTARVNLGRPSEVTTADTQSTLSNTQDPGDNIPIGGAVRSCICFDVSFERIQKAADNSERGLLEAHRKTGCGGRCGLCLPYIKLMLMTGRTTLPVMWTEQFTKLGINPGRVRSIERAIARQQAAMDAGSDQSATG